MIEYLAGFLGGIYITVLGGCLFGVISIHWFIMLIVGILLLIGTFGLKMYLMMSDYREIANMGVSAGKFVVNKFKERRK